MKIVSNKTTGEIITIDENKEPDRMEKYNHRSGQPFVVKPVQEMSVDELEALVKAKKSPNVVDQKTPKSDTSGEVEQLPIEELHELYTQTTGKNLSPRYKKDTPKNREWILSKLS